ncbi:MAG TPA: FAD-dependent oxidoreductase, partial [Salinimicrobium sp.]|nr:FAD-dependent oxidoreductase [Salinimicrobium sp.]
MSKKKDAIIIGSGINGIAAAIRLQQTGVQTAIYEQEKIPGGATKTQELTLEGFKHDVGSAILPMGVASPFLRKLPLEQFGLEWVHPEIPYSQPFSDGTAYACYRGVEETAAQLGEDRQAYLDIFGQLVSHWEDIGPDLLGPLHFPDHPMEFVKFGLKALPSSKMLVNHYYKNEKSKIFFYGSAAHSTLPLTSIASASFGLVLTTTAHKFGWPFPKGGAGNFTKALLGYYFSIGGELDLNVKVEDIHELP